MAAARLAGPCLTPGRRWALRRPPQRACGSTAAAPPTALLLLDPALSPTRQRSAHLLELSTLASLRGARLAPLLGERGWVWSVHAASPDEAAAAARAVAAEASAASGAVVGAVCGWSPAGLVAAAQRGLRQTGRWALRRETGGTRRSATGGQGRQASVALAAALGRALGGEPAADGLAERELALVLLGEEGGGRLFLGEWVPAAVTSRWAEVAEAWGERPFQFSAGLDLRVAQAAVALALAPSRRARGGSAPRTLLVDPCCGSGSTIFCALHGPAPIPQALVALDVNARHVQGTLQNLRPHAAQRAPAGGLGLGWARLSAGGTAGGADFYAGVQDAACGAPLPVPPGGGGAPWQLAGVANLAWGNRQRTTEQQTAAFLAGLRQTFAAFPRRAGAGPPRLCCVLGAPEAAAARLLREGGWPLVGGPAPIFRSNCNEKVLCSLALCELQ